MASDKKPRKRANTTPSKNQDAKKVKKTIHLSVKADQRLGVHATMSGKSASELVEELILTHLRRYQVSDLDKGGSPPEGEGA